MPKTRGRRPAARYLTFVAPTHGSDAISPVSEYAVADRNALGLQWANGPLVLRLQFK